MEVPSRKLARVAAQLAPAPAPVRNRMLAGAAGLKPGEAAVVGRFFGILMDRGEKRPCRAGPASISPRSRSRPFRHFSPRWSSMPRMSVWPADARPARPGMPRDQKGPGKPARRKGPGPIPTEAPAHWPEEWRELFPGLLQADIRDTSKRRYIASISRCADFVPGIDAEPELSR